MPRLHDDGHAVTLDLHGATVDEAERILRRVVPLAAERGRGQLTVIHGSSTSSRLYRNRTVRHALYDLLDSGALAEVASEFRRDDACLLALHTTGARDERRLSLSDVR